MAKEIWLFTMRFPYGDGETFIETELPILCRQVDRVRVIPLQVAGVPRAMPANAEVVDVLDDPFRSAGIADLLRHGRTLWRVARSIRSTAPGPETLRRQWPDLRSRLLQSLRRATRLRRMMFEEYDPDRVVLYSFWTADWATVLGLLKLWDPRVHFVSRMLGFDLFDFRSRDAWPAFRRFQLEQVDRVFIISQAGLDHMRERYPRFAGKFRLSPLASPDHGMAPWSPSTTLRLVSCSSLIPLKRVHLIADALSLVTGDVEWTHFGEGPERAAIEARIAGLPANVRVILMGQRTNTSLLEWYRHHPVDLFVHVSSTEGGLPVALQEAASFGIPLLAVDAGGVKEIVNERTGTLLSHEATIREIAKHLGAHLGSVRDRLAFRQGVRAYWAANCRAEEVYGTFCRELLSGHAERPMTGLNDQRSIPTRAGAST